jgi:hypothetical protein
MRGRGSRQIRTLSNGAEAQPVIADRLSRDRLYSGSKASGSPRTRSAPTSTTSLTSVPNGLHDLGKITEVLQSWPRDESFCVEILFVTHP